MGCFQSIPNVEEYSETKNDPYSKWVTVTGTKLTLVAKMEIGNWRVSSACQFEASACCTADCNVECVLPCWSTDGPSDVQTRFCPHFHPHPVVRCTRDSSTLLLECVTHPNSASFSTFIHRMGDLLPRPARVYPNNQILNFPTSQRDQILDPSSLCPLGLIADVPHPKLL